MPHLQLVEFGCPGDTSTSLMTGIGNYALARRLHCDRTTARSSPRPRRSCGRITGLVRCR